jgi:hypothetical protein
VVAYFRKYDEFVCSWHQQRIKAKTETRSLQEFLDYAIRRMNYSDVLEKWSDVFGIPQVVPRIIQPDGFDTIQDFCSLIDVDTRRLTSLKQPRNVSFPDSVIELKRHLNRYIETPDQQRCLMGILRKSLRTSSCRRQSGTVEFSPEQLKGFADQIAWMEQQFNVNASALLPEVSRDVIEQQSAPLWDEDVSRVLEILLRKAEALHRIRTHPLVSILLRLRRTGRRFRNMLPVRSKATPVQTGGSSK